MRKWFIGLLIVLSGSEGVAAHLSDGEGLLFAFDERSDKVVNRDDRPLLQVFGNGAIVVTRPWHRRDRGVYEGTLAPGELQRLRATVAAARIWEFDLASAQRRAHAAVIAANRANGIARYQSEVTVSRIAIQLEGQTLPWQAIGRNLNQLSRRHAGPELTAWLRVSEALRALVDHPSLVRVSDVPLPTEIVR